MMVQSVVMIRKQVQLTEEQDRRLEALAMRSGRSKADLVRRAVDLLLAERVAMPTVEEQRKRALEAIGAFHSGHSDIAVDHDRYLAASYASDGPEAPAPE